MSFTALEYVRHMLGEADFLVEQTRGLSKTDFLKDEVLLRAFVRSIEVIGEASKQIPLEFRARYPQIDWRIMAGINEMDPQREIIDFDLAAHMGHTYVSIS